MRLPKSIDSLPVLLIPHHRRNRPLPWRGRHGPTRKNNKRLGVGTAKATKRKAIARRLRVVVLGKRQLKGVGFSSLIVRDSIEKTPVGNSSPIVRRSLDGVENPERAVLALVVGRTRGCSGVKWNSVVVRTL